MKVDLTKFDTIIFDFGGVILDIDPERTRNSFISLIGEELVNKLFSSDLLSSFEKGECGAIALRNAVEELSSMSINESAFNRAWNAMLVDYKPKRIERIQWLAKSHKLIMLSNTNELHYAFFSQKLKNEYGVSFTDLFQNVYLSHEMGLLKPDLEIYRKVLIEQNLNPERTLFIEDTKENALAANKLGIETLVIPRNGSFYEFFL